MNEDTGRWNMSLKFGDTVSYEINNVSRLVIGWYTFNIKKNIIWEQSP